MLVVEATHRGMCFGVNDALEAMRQIKDPSRVTVYGELVHNPVVTEELRHRGFVQQAEVDRDRSPSTPEVLITAHGVSNQTMARLTAQGFRLHDTTCPLVRRAHKACLHYHNRGYFIVLVGKSGHVEVEGLTGDLQHYVVVSHPDEVKGYCQADKIAVVNQTTTRPDELKEFHRLVRERNQDKEVVLVDTTCQPTRDRQLALDELLDRVEGLVVVGGPNSNNTRQLGLKAAEKGLPWWQVATAQELESEWFRDIRVVGLSAGTSTTEETIREVARRLRRINGAVPERRTTQRMVPGIYRQSQPASA